jgi:hypothetical protein
MTQRQQVRKHLIQKGSLTQLQATIQYGIQRLSPRIQELREAGMNIKSIPLEVEGHHPNPPVKYHLIDKGNNGSRD